MTRSSLLSLALVTAACAGCHEPEEVNAGESHDRHARLNAAGNYDLFVGPGISDRLAHPDELGRAAYFMVGDVSPGLIEAARRKPNRVVSLAINAPTPAPLTLVVSYPGRRGVKKIAVKTGDPMASGVVQIWIDDRGSPVGLFELRRWQRAADGKLSSDTYSTGLLPDPEMPPSIGPH